MDDLQTSLVNQWLLKLAEDGYKPISVRGKKAGITAIWNHAAELGLVAGYNPLRLRRVRIAHQPPQPFSREQVRHLLVACGRVVGDLKGVDAGLALRCYVLLQYETGLRPVDMLLVRRSQIDERRVLRLVQHKTGQPHQAKISAGTLHEIDKMFPPRDDQLFPLSRSGFRRWELILFAAAHTRRRPRQGLGAIRKTYASEVARLHGVEQAARGLGHISGTDVALKFYIASEDKLPLKPPPLTKGPRPTPRNDSLDAG